MPVAPNDRPLADVREETIDTLVVNYGRGVLSLDAFERRLDAALEAESGDALTELTADLAITADVEALRKEQARQGWQVSAPRGLAAPRMINVFGGGKRSGTWTVGPELQVICVFGGAEVDFSAATFSAPVTRMRTYCIFGGAQLTVNEHTNVVNNLVCVFGGAEDRTSNRMRPDAPTIVLEGLVLFGGIGVRVRKALKERWLAFADQMRNAIGT